MPRDANHKPRVGVPYRTAKEEAAGESKRHRIDRYLRMVEQAGGEPLLISLQTPRAKLEELAKSLDAFVLPGSPADVNPEWYHAPRHPQTADADAHREQADFTLLDVAFRERKPVKSACSRCASASAVCGCRGA